MKIFAEEILNSYCSLEKLCLYCSLTLEGIDHVESPGVAA
jgi:hypothetical protein